MDYNQAVTIAINVKDELAIFCDKIAIAGSIRRMKPEVKDIEIVCEPKRNPNPSVFQSDYPLLDYLHNPTGYLSRCKKIKGQDRYQQWRLPDIMLDLFIVLPPAQWGVILAIRTGPAEFSKALVTQRRYGGLLPSSAMVRDGCVLSFTNQEIKMPEEKDFFAYCGLDFIEPKDRKGEKV